MTRRAGLLGLALLAAMSSADAQGNPLRTRPGAARRPAQRILDENGQPAQRRAVEQQIRQRLWQVTKTRLALSDEQMTKLESVSDRFDQRRRQLAQQEKVQRQALRGEVLADTAANQGNIASALEQIQQIQRQRTEMQAEEQKEFSSFMTPLQRAQFMALQEQFRKRMQELVKARADSTRAPALQSP